MSHARNIVLFLWLALAASFIRNIGLSDGFAAIFSSVVLMLLGLVLMGITLLYLMLRRWLQAKTSVEPSSRFVKWRRTLRFLPVIPAVLFFIFVYNTEYGDYVLMYRDMNPTRLEHLLDSLGITLNLTFICYAVIELFLFLLLWQKRKQQAAS